MYHYLVNLMFFRGYATSDDTGSSVAPTMKTNVIPEQKQITVPEQVTTVAYFSVKAIINIE